MDQWPGVAGFFALLGGGVSVRKASAFPTSPPSQPPSCFLAFHFLLFLFLFILLYLVLFYFEMGSHCV